MDHDMLCPIFVSTNPAPRFVCLYAYHFAVLPPCCCRSCISLFSRRIHRVKRAHFAAPIQRFCWKERSDEKYRSAPWVLTPANRCRDSFAFPAHLPYCFLVLEKAMQ